jgi:hypothetical protein
MLIPTQNSNKTNYKIQDCFANRQIKEDVKCNRKKHAILWQKEKKKLARFGIKGLVIHPTKY